MSVFRAMLILVLALVSGCAHRPAVGARLERIGDEIVVCGQLFHTGATVITWMDPGGYDAYRVERRFSSLPDRGWEESKKGVKELQSPNRYGLRQADLSPGEVEQVRGGGWPIALLREHIDQFVLHYDVAGTSRQCFNILHDHRDLSVHFMLDLDGTIYQTLDLKERAWHATIANDRSIGIEIANIGAYGEGEKSPLAEWYRKDPGGRTRIVVPLALGGGKYLRTPNFVGRPMLEEAVSGVVQGRTLRQYDLTPQQYDSLIKLTATLCTVFPKLGCDYPRGADGKVIPHRLTDSELAGFHGILGHYHIQADKVDPGPALQWDRVIGGAKSLMGKS